MTRNRHARPSFRWPPTVGHLIAIGGAVAFVTAISMTAYVGAEPRAAQIVGSILILIGGVFLVVTLVVRSWIDDDVATNTALEPPPDASDARRFAYATTMRYIRDAVLTAKRSLLWLEVVSAALVMIGAGASLGALIISAQQPITPQLCSELTAADRSKELIDAFCTPLPPR